MIPMYKKGGKKSPKKKSSFMEESKELKFGDKPKKFKTGGMYTAAEVSANKKKVSAMNAMQNADQQSQTKKKSGGFPDLNKDGKTTFADVLKGRGVGEKKTGGKSMEPGGGGRFAKMVGKLKKKGKSEDSAKAIAASIGRKKYGKSKFQEMAAKGKKGLGGMSDSTSSNDAGMEMMENMEAMGPKKPKKKKGSSGTRYTGPNAGRAKKAQKRVQSGRGGCNRGEVCFD